MNIEPVSTTPDGKKGRPTPKRKAAEAARIHPLVPKDRKEAKRAARAARNARAAHSGSSCSRGGAVERQAAAHPQSARAEGAGTESTRGKGACAEARATRWAAVQTPQRMIAVDGRGRGVPADHAVRVPVSVHSRMQQIDVHKIVRVCYGVETRAEFAFGHKRVWDALR